MGKTVFKRLLEVQVIHDYFLTMADGASFFEKNQDEKQKLLEQKITKGLYSSDAIFEIEAVADTKKRLREYKLIFLQTPLGFLVATEVNEVVVAGELLYKPKLPIPTEVALSFSLKSKLPYFKSLTNIQLATPYPAIYYFTNKDRQELVEFTIPPYNSKPLSQDALSPQAGTIYEMGTILNFGGTVREAIQKTDGSNPAHWEDIIERKVVTLADNMLLPHNFKYKFREDQLVTQVEITLVDATNTEVKKIIKTSTEVLADILLNFTKVDENDDTSANIPSGIYSLKLLINGTTEITHHINLNNDLYNREYLGIVQIRFDEENSPFSLFDAQGFLKTKIDGLGEKISHPIFEIRFENRRTYWRYNKSNAFTTDEINATHSFLDAFSTNLLIAKKPKALTATLVPFQNGTVLMLPHPKTPNIRVEQDKIYSEIYINQSNGLLKT